MGMLIVFVMIVGGYGKAEAMPQTSAQGPKFYAYYYLWWSTNHWHEKLGPNYPYPASPLPLPGSTDPDGCGPVSQYAGNQLLDVPATLFSQDDPGQIESDIRMAKDAGLSGFWLNWQGDGSTTQTLTSVPYTRRLNEAFAASSRVGGFANWVSYQAFTVPSADTVINDLNFLYAQFSSNAAWEKVDGEPVVVFTGSRKYSDVDITRVSNAVRNKFYFVGDESATSLTDARMGYLMGSLTTGRARILIGILPLLTRFGRWEIKFMRPANAGLLHLRRDTIPSCSQEARPVFRVGMATRCGPYGVATRLRIRTAGA
jgi:hypothetical protein